MEGLKSLAYRGHTAQDLIDTINLAARWKPRALSDRFWDLLGHKSKVVRETAARCWGGSVPRSCRARPGCSKSAKPIARRRGGRARDGRHPRGPASPRKASGRRDRRRHPRRHAAGPRRRPGRRRARGHARGDRSAHCADHREAQGTRGQLARRVPPAGPAVSRRQSPRFRGDPLPPLSPVAGQGDPTRHRGAAALRAHRPRDQRRLCPRGLPAVRGVEGRRQGPMGPGHRRTARRRPPRADPQPGDPDLGRVGPRQDGRVRRAGPGACWVPTRP